LPTKPFPYTTDIFVHTGDIVSKEGPVPGADHAFSFSTCSQLSVTGRYVNNKLKPIYLRFNQAIVTEANRAEIVLEKMVFLFLLLYSSNFDKKWCPTLTPAHPGKWVLQDTKTIVFMPEEPLRKSSKYTVKVPGILSSVFNEPLGKDYSFEFATPMIKEVSQIPETLATLSNNPILLLEFDQLIEPEQAVKLVKFKIGNIITGKLFVLQTFHINIIRDK
jgi:hypothetical protein